MEQCSTSVKNKRKTLRAIRKGLKDKADGKEGNAYEAAGH